jgi:cell division protein FtsB
MSEAEDSRLYGLMEIAEGQQAAVQAALEGLAAERAALRREREALARQVQAVEGGARAAVRAAVAESLAGAATEGVAAVQEATRPLLDRVAGVTAEAGQAEAALRGVVLWASWRLLGWIAAVGAMTVLLGWLMSSGVLWWNTSAIGAAQERKAELQAEVAELQANRDALVKAGVMSKLERCNPGYRPCIRVDESAGGFGDRGDFRVILGY